MAMDGAGDHEPGGRTHPRVLLLSLRSYERNRAHVTQFEFEDVICAVDSAHVLAPRRRSQSEAAMLLHRVRNKGRRLVGRMAQDAFVDEQEVADDYDLFFAVFHFPRDLTHLRHVKHWRRRCRKAVAFVIEMWSTELDAARQYLPLLEQFDQVFLFNAASIPRVAKLMGAADRLPGVSDVEARLQPSLLGARKQCPNCSEYLPGTAVACPYCGETVPG